ncbi:hypothetical protein [Parachlamydia sp. AcF125]|uniref:hypothetical protein n=1 Tax=Parachlamydia sp. AcF125 TaxID=2795736 RepID=UPI001BC9A16C|nr:hypothetical protein [Parachlamydia sp. AcF125]MBS4167408.1 hypothetical protein [Parachlamydia sp. AcF125]
MQLSFTQIHEAVGGCKNSTAIRIKTKPLDSGHPVTHCHYVATASPTSFWPFGSQRTKIRKQDEKTMERFTKLIGETAPPAIKTQLIHELESQKKGTKLTASKIREIYSACLASHLNGPRIAACLARAEFARVIFDEKSQTYRTQKAYFGAFRKKIRMENQNALRKCYETFVEEWGKERVDRALAKYSLNWETLCLEGKPLTVGLINKMTGAIAELQSEDLPITWNKVREICLDKAPVDLLPSHHRKKLAEILNTHSDEELKIELTTKYLPYLSSSYDQLPQEVQELFSKVTLLDENEGKRAFQEIGQIVKDIGSCKNSAPVQIKLMPTYAANHARYYTVAASASSFWSFGSQRTKIREQNRETIGHFIQLVQETAHPDIAPQLIRKLESQKKKGAQLTVGKIRKIYSQCIASHLSGLRKIACLAQKESARVIFDEKSQTYRTQKAYFGSFRKKTRRENQTALRKCYEAFVKEWGKERVDRALARYEINLNRLHVEGKPLTASIINKMTLGVADFYVEDLHATWDKVQKVCLDETTVDTLPSHHRKKLAKILNTNSEEELKTQLTAKCLPYLSKPYDQLPHALHHLLSNATLLDADELELMFQGKRMEGIITGYPPLSMLYFYYPLHVEDKSRLQLYHTILTLSKRVFAKPDILTKATWEIFAKAFIKFRVAKDMLVPFPPETTDNNSFNWYRIMKKIEPGGSKLAFHLSQLHQGGPELPDILCYRSTTSVPTQQKCLETLIEDSWLLGPGYFPFYRWKGMKEEDQVLFSNTHKPLVVLGHSLGGSHSQLFLINRLQKDGPKLPDRDIHIVTFDSPAPRTKDAIKVSKFLHENHRVKIKFYFSLQDSIPGAGGAFPGFDMAAEAINKVECIVADALKLKHPALNLHPHGRFYYLSPDLHYEERATEVEKFSSEAWRAKTELIRKVVSLFLFPPILILGYTKRLLMGRTGRSGSLRVIFNKIFRISPKPKTKIKNYGIELV